jgi:hypothetical protein
VAMVVFLLSSRGKIDFSHIISSFPHQPYARGDRSFVAGTGRPASPAPPCPSERRAGTPFSSSPVTKPAMYTVPQNPSRRRRFSPDLGQLRPRPPSPASRASLSRVPCIAGPWGGAWEGATQSPWPAASPSFRVAGSNSCSSSSFVQRGAPRQARAR